MNDYIYIYGAGLAGCEAAWQAAKANIKVKLYEMKPGKMTPAHHSGNFAELVCSNSLRSNSIENAVGLIKEEMRRHGSLIMEAAEACRVPAGSALAVDREGFSRYITRKIKENDLIEVINEEVTSFSEDEITIVATGPLTGGKFADFLKVRLGDEYLSFFDAAAPIVEYDSIDLQNAFFASRYDKGDKDYINCPMTKEEYDVFYRALISAECAVLKDFENENPNVFEGCMPVEVMAKRGYEALLFGPLKPVGLIDPKTGQEAFATVQLRQDNAAATLYNLVGFQTHLTFPEQKRVFSLIPALKDASFLRYGVMHRNTFINSPKHLTPYGCLRKNSNIFFAGQLNGVEGYIESAGSGLVCGINAARLFLGRDMIDYTRKTALGALKNYISDEAIKSFQPMNINFGIIDPPGIKVKGGKKAKNLVISERSLEIIDCIVKELS